MNRILKQNTGVTILIGQLFNWADSKTLLYEALGGNNYTPSTLVLKISKGSTQSTLTLTLSGGTNNFNLLADGMASLVLTSGNTDTCGDFIITLCNATVGSEVVFPCKFEFTVLSAEMYDKLMGAGNLTVLLTSAYDAAKTAASESNATANRDTITTAITNKAVTPVTDLSLVAKTTELSAVKLAADGLDNIPITESTGGRLLSG